MHYNKDALRGGDTSDREFITDIKEIFPEMHLPVALAETPALVPTSISEMERLNRTNLPRFKNPLTGKNYSQTEAANEAKSVADAALEDYQQLLAIARKRSNKPTIIPELSQNRVEFQPGKLKSRKLSTGASLPTANALSLK